MKIEIFASGVFAGILFTLIALLVAMKAAGRPLIWPVPLVLALDCAGASLALGGFFGVGIGLTVLAPAVLAADNWMRVRRQAPQRLREIRTDGRFFEG